MDRKLLIHIITKDIRELSTLSEGFLEMDKIPASYLELSKSKALAIADEFKQLIQISQQKQESNFVSKVSSNIFEEHKEALVEPTHEDVEIEDTTLAVVSVKENTKASEIEEEKIEEDSIPPEIEAQMDAIDAEEDVKLSLLEDESFAVNALNDLDNRIGLEIVETKEDIQEGYEKVSTVAQEVAQEVDDYFTQVHKKSEKEIKEFQRNVVNKARFLARKLRGESEPIHEEEVSKESRDDLKKTSINELKNDSENAPLNDLNENLAPDLKNNSDTVSTINRSVSNEEQFEEKKSGMSNYESVIDEELTSKIQDNLSPKLDENIEKQYTTDLNKQDSKDVTTTSLGDSLHGDTSIQENYNSEADSLNSRLSKQKIRSIGQSISFVDSFMYQRELFQGDGELMRITFDKLDAYATLEDALEYLHHRFNWNEEKEGVTQFYALLERRY